MTNKKAFLNTILYVVVLMMFNQALNIIAAPKDLSVWEHLFITWAFYQFVRLIRFD
jgi:hypothetical protein